MFNWKIIETILSHQRFVFIHLQDKVYLFCRSFAGFITKNLVLFVWFKCKCFSSFSLFLSPLCLSLLCVSKMLEREFSTRSKIVSWKVRTLTELDMEFLNDLCTRLVCSIARRANFLVCVRSLNANEANIQTNCSRHSSVVVDRLAICSKRQVKN